MAKKVSKNGLKGLKYTSELRDALTDIARNTSRSSEDYKFAQGLKQFGRDAGMLTISQLRTMGRIYKRVVNGGQYVHHDWWV